jgi:hypothetical protein
VDLQRTEFAGGFVRAAEVEIEGIGVLRNPVTAPP